MTLSADMVLQVLDNIGLHRICLASWGLDATHGGALQVETHVEKP